MSHVGSNDETDSALLSDDPTTLRALADHRDQAVREAVAGNGRTPEEVLDRLTRDSDIDVRVAAASNPLTPLPALHLMLRKDPEGRAIMAATRALDSRAGEEAESEAPVHVSPDRPAEMSFSEAIGSCFRKYAVFSGRAGRTEYWAWFVLVLPLNLIAALEVTGALRLPGTVRLLVAILLVALFLPSLSVFVRRLHDTNRSGWFWFLVLIPVAGPVILIVFLLGQGDPGTNLYGPPSGA